MSPSSPPGRRTSRSVRTWSPGLRSWVRARTPCPSRSTSSPRPSPRPTPRPPRAQPPDGAAPRTLAPRRYLQLVPRLFGTDGIRGAANVELKPTTAYALGRAVAHRLVGGRGAIVVGQDTRRSGDLFVAGITAGGTAH